MTYKIQFLAAAMVFLFPFFSQGEDISTISIEKNGDMVEAPALAPVSLEAWIPKKVKKESSLQTEDQGLRQAVLDYFADSTYDESQMNYACNFTDLSGDGGKEALVLLESPYTDRDGKPELLIFTRDGEGWHMEQEITGISVPFLIPRRDKKAGSSDFSPPLFHGRRRNRRDNGEKTEPSGPSLSSGRQRGAGGTEIFEKNEGAGLLLRRE